MTAAATSSVKDIVLKPCEIESCKRISFVSCRHCNKEVCRHHLNEHVSQIIKELDPLADSINKLDDKISSFNVKEYKEKLFDKLTQWHDKAIKDIHELYELKKQELDLLLEENEQIFSQQTKNHLEILDILKNETTIYMNENDVTFEQLQILKEKLRILQNNVNQTHTNLVRCDIKPLFINYDLVLVYATENNSMYGGKLLSTDHQIKLNDFYENSKQKWQLVYKATRDGFLGEDFHRCSDYKGSTMTIIQSKDGKYLFGGFAELSWTSDNKYKTDPEAFLFTLTNPHGIRPTKFSIKSNASYALGHSKSSGPYFGGVVKDEEHFVDIRILNNANKNRNSQCSFPSSYIDTTGKGNTLFTGEKNFMVEEIEVYKLLVSED